MADKKISALTGASTPLAGTEVLPIVQSGSTVKVSVANLTAGRDVSARDITTTGNTILGDASADTLNVGNGDIIKDANGNVGVGQASPYNNAAFKTLAVGGSKVGFIGLYNASNVMQATLDTFDNKFRIGTNGTTNPIIFQLGGSVTNTLTLDNSLNVTANAGNFIIGTAGKGFTLPGGITWTSGSGSPEGVVTAPVGSLYSRSDGGLLSSLYVKESGSGNTGWVGK